MPSTRRLPAPVATVLVTGGLPAPAHAASIKDGCCNTLTFSGKYYGKHPHGP